MIVALEFLFEALGDINVAGFQLLQFGGNALVEVTHRQAELVAAGIVIKRHGGLVRNRPLKVIRRNIVAEYPPCDFVIREKWRARETDVRCVRQGVAHVQRQGSILRAVRLIRDDDDVLALRIRLARLYIAVERSRAGHGS